MPAAGTEEWAKKLGYIREEKEVKEEAKNESE
jgi:hypothetical protein